MPDKPAALTRPKRASAKATADKINASLKAESAKIGERESEEVEPKAPKDVKPKVKPEPKSSKSAGKRPIATISLVDDEEQPAPKAKKAAPAPKAKKAASSKAAAAPAPAQADTGEVLLGYFISKCVGIQHYHNNGARYNKEPLHLRRDPNNPYDKNAVSVRTIAGKPVGHMQRVDALAVARVADDKSMRIKMVAQVESGATQTYKFPLRVSFFGLATTRDKVAAHLAYTAMSKSMYGRPEMGGGIVLLEPKRRGRGAGGGRGGRGRGGRGQAAATSSGAAGASAPLEHEVAAAPDDDDDGGEIEVMGEKSWHERDQELRKHAIELE